MKLWPFGERRAAPAPPPVVSEYTERMIEGGAVYSTGTGRNPYFPGAVAAIEACVLAYRRALEAAEVSGPSWAVDAIQPVLGDIADDCTRTGEYLGLLAMRGGMLRLDSARVAFIDGRDPDPDTWRYDLTIETPTSTVSRRVRADEVVHVTWAVRRGQPWRGVSPMHGSTRTRNLLDGIERAMSVEARSANARLFAESIGPHGAQASRGAGAVARQSAAPVPNMSDGKIISLPAFFGDKLIETRPKFDGAMVDAWQTCTRLICTAHGIPVQLALPSNADGTSLREAYRRWYAASLRPFASRIERALRHRVDASIRIELEALRALDMGLCPRCGGPGRDWYVGEGYEANGPADGLCATCEAIPPAPVPRGLEAFYAGRWWSQYFQALFSAFFRTLFCTSNSRSSARPPPRLL